MTPRARRRVALALVLAAVGLTACDGGGGAVAPSTSPPPTVSGSPPPTTPSTPTPEFPDVRPNPLGVQPANQVLPIRVRVDVARRLGATYIRPGPFLTTAPTVQCPDCPAIHAAGLHVVLTVANRTSVDAAATFPTDMEAYRDRVAGAIRAYRPSLLVVENEQNALKYYLGTAAQYETQLRAACQVAHRMDVPCTDGGLQSPSVAVLTYQHYVDTGQTDAAASYASRVFGPLVVAQLQTPEGAAATKAQAERLRSFLDVVAPAGADYVNFHWYLRDAQALGETIDYLEQATGLKVVCNEMGQRTDDPDVPVRLLQTAFDRGLPFVVWYSIDGLRTVALNEPNGTLRPNGLAVRQLIEDRYGA